MIMGMASTYSSQPVSVVNGDPAAASQRFVGISAASGGATALSMQLVVVPPGATASPHLHPNHETIVYIVSGEVEVLSGDDLEHRHVCGPGDFVLTPPGVVHAPRNVSETEPVVVIAARNDPSEHEETVPVTQ